MLALRLVNLDHPPHFDELYHVLAAQAWLQDGSFCIADCLAPYTRGALFTFLAAGSFWLLGTVDVVAARLPSVIAGALTILLVFAWTFRYAGRAAAWVSALLLAVVPLTIHMSQFARFYALHALLFWIGALAVYLMATGGARGRHVLLVGLTAGVAFLAALHLQIMTLLGLTALAVWVTVDPLPAFVRRHREDRRLWWAAGAAAVVLVAVAVAAVGSGLLQDLWQRYRWSHLMALDARDDVLFYHRWMHAEYGPLYAFLPAATIVALARATRPALFCAVIVVVAFGLHSFGGFKGFRLIYWIMPAFFVLWGIAAAAVAEPLFRLAARAADGIAAGQLPDRWRSVVGLGAVTVAVMFVVGNTNAFRTTHNLLTLPVAEWSDAMPWYRGHSDWPAALEILEPVANRVDVVLSSSTPKAFYYLGRSDASISANQLLGLDDRISPEFTVDPRLGDPIISQPGSVERVMGCYESGLIVVEMGHWRNPAAVLPVTSDFIEEAAEEIPLGRGWRLRAFQWQRPEGDDIEPHADLEATEDTCDPPPLEVVPRDGPVKSSGAPAVDGSRPLARSG